MSGATGVVSAGPFHGTGRTPALDGTARVRLVNALWTRQLAQVLAGHDATWCSWSTPASRARPSWPDEALTVWPAAERAGIRADLGPANRSRRRRRGIRRRVCSSSWNRAAAGTRRLGADDQAIRLARWSVKLRACRFRSKSSWPTGPATQIVPNLGWNPAEREDGRRQAPAAPDDARGRGASARTRRRVCGAPGLRAQIADWLASATHGMFVVTGGPVPASGAGGLLRASRSAIPSLVVLDEARRSRRHVRRHRPRPAKDARTGAGRARGCDRGGPGHDPRRRPRRVRSGESIGIAGHLRPCPASWSAHLSAAARARVATRIGAGIPLWASLARPRSWRLDSSTPRRATSGLSPRGAGRDPGCVRGTDTSALVGEVANRPRRASVRPRRSRWLTCQAEPITKFTDWHDRSRGSGEPTPSGSLSPPTWRPVPRARSHAGPGSPARPAWAEGLGLPRYTIWPELPRCCRHGSPLRDPDVTWVAHEAGCISQKRRGRPDRLPLFHNP